MDEALGLILSIARQNKYKQRKPKSWKKKASI
jgi:hypothetical protein